MAVRLNDGVITFRHSIRKTANGRYGYPIVARVKKLDLQEQANVVLHLEKLQKFTGDDYPTERPEWASVKSWEIWGTSLPTKWPPPTIHNIKDARLENAIDDAKEDGNEPDESYFKLALAKQQMERHYRDEIKKREKRIRELEALLDSYATAAGLASDAESDFTMQEAYVYALHAYKAKSETSTNNALTKVAYIVELLGHDMKWIDLNSREIEDAIERGAIECNWAYNTKRQFRHVAKHWLSLVQEDLKFRHNPTKGLVVGAVQAGGEEKSMLDPREALRKLEGRKEEKYERLKLLIAFCGFAGMRLSEALRLDWAGVQLPVIEVEQALKGTKGQKTKMRWAYAFSNLEKYLPKKLPKSGRIFPETYYNYDASSEARDLFGPEPFNSLRHWHSTEMAKDKELRELEAIANGHTKKVAATNYQDAKTLLLGVGKKKIG